MKEEKKMQNKNTKKLSKTCRDKHLLQMIKV